MSKRNYTIDILRFISAIMVIAIHSAPFENLNEQVYLCVQRICSFAVPFFFAVSGFYFLGFTVESREKAKKNLRRIISVYFFWSIVYFVIALIKWGYRDIIAYVKELLLGLFFIGSNYHLWFMPVLIYAMLAYFVISLLLKKNILVVFEILLSVSGLVLLIADIKFPDSLGFIKTFVNNMIKALTYFSAGGIIARIYRKNIGIVASACAVVLCFISKIFFGSILPSSLISNILLIAFVFLAILLALKYPISVRNPKKAEWLAPASRFSYYAHDIFLTIYRIVLSSVPLWLHNTALFFLTSITVTAISLLLYNKKSKIIRQLFM